jgi:hypothetical protein
MNSTELGIWVRSGGFGMEQLDEIASTIGREATNGNVEYLREIALLLREAKRACHGDVARQSMVIILESVLLGADGAQRRIAEIRKFRALSDGVKEALLCLEHCHLTFEELQEQTSFGKGYVSYIVSVLTEQKLVDQIDSGTGLTVYVISPRGFAALHAILSA